MSELLSDRRALVCGARGFIGRNLVSELLTRGWHVRALTRRHTPQTPTWEAPVEWIEFDGADRARAFDRALAGVSVVFNLAGSSGAVASNTDPLESLESNCRLQLEFLAACARTGSVPHVVFASSRLVYAPAGRDPITEAHAVAPQSMYAAHKLCVEHYHRIFAQRGSITFTICRISNPYGLDEAAPGKGYGFVNALIQRALAGETLTLFGNGRQLRDYLYIDDLVALLRLCGERDEARNELMNVGFGSSVSIRDTAALIQQTLGGGAVEFRPWPIDYEAVESGDFVVSVGKARTVLDWSPSFTLEAGLREVRARCASLWHRGAATLATVENGPTLHAGTVR